MLNILVVAAGGAMGAVARHLLSLWAGHRFGVAFPYGTFIANLGGCFIIGAVMSLTTERFIVSPYWRLLVTVGFAGGLTTFSSFSYETISLLQEAQFFSAFANIALNLAAGLLATWLGMSAVRLI